MKRGYFCLLVLVALICGSTCFAAERRLGDRKERSLQFGSVGGGEVNHGPDEGISTASSQKRA